MGPSGPAAAGGDLVPRGTRGGGGLDGGGGRTRPALGRTCPSAAEDVFFELGFRTGEEEIRMEGV